MADKSSSRHDPDTGALSKKFEEVPNHSASNWKSYLSSPDHYTHPFRYPAGVSLVVGSLGSGKSTLIYNLLQELSEVIKPEKTGRIIYYSGSSSDELTKAYDPERVEIFDKRSKESFLTAMKEIQNEAPNIKHKDKKMNILIIDDACNDSDIMPHSVKSTTELSSIMMSARHIPVSIFLTSQKYSSLPSFAKANASHLFAFRSKCPSEQKAILNDANFCRSELEDAFNSLTSANEFLWLQQSDRRIIKGLNQPICY